MPPIVHAIPYAQVNDTIRRLIDNMVNIEDESGTFLLRLDDGRVIDTKGWNDWEWTHGIGLYGIFKHWQLTADPRALAIIQDWFRNRFAAGTPTKNVNTVAPFLTAAYLVERTGDQTFLPYLDVWGEWIMRGMPRTEENGLQHIVFNSENPQQLWDDTLMMCALPLAKIGLLLGRPAYIEEAKRQFLLHAKYLSDPETGLWFHGWTFAGRHHFARARWARGNAWVTIAIPEFVELLELEPGDAVREFLVGTLRTQVKALAAHQDQSGLWHTLIDDPSSYCEASATAGFAYGILKGVRLGHLDTVYEDVGIRAIEAVLGQISAAGELQNVSFGTPVFASLQEYKEVPLTSMPYGQAMAILALAEFATRYL
jgi:unsaturated rhamnogalacturonyl hydrolase